MGRKITVMNGDHDPVVLDGHLTHEQIEKVARKYGGVGDGGYAGLEIAHLNETTWFVTYARHPGWRSVRYGREGKCVRESNRGDVSLVVVHTETTEVPA